jgi:hypothetical protein
MMNATHECDYGKLIENSWYIVLTYQEYGYWNCLFNYECLLWNVASSSPQSPK